MTMCQFYADHLSKYIRAGTIEADPDELRQLACSSIERIRVRLAENHRTPKDALAALASDRSADVRAAVATNPSTPYNLVLSLACDSDPSVRWHMAEDYNMKEQVLLKLADDSNPYVSCRAKKTLEALRRADYSRSIEDKKTLRWMKQGSGVPRDDLQYA